MAEALPFIVLNLDRPRKLRFDLNSLVLIQSRYGVDLSKLDEFLKSCVNDPERLRFLFYAGLKWEDPSLTEEKVGDIISFDKILNLVDQVVSQLSDSIEDDELRKKEKRAAEEKNGAGLPPSKLQAESESSQKSSIS